jgi:lysophospholipase L1-like esterase
VVFAGGPIAASSAAVAADFYLRDGDRVVFYGDSITEQRLYTTAVEEFVIRRFPDRDVRFVHSGIGGDRVTGGWAGPIEVRLQRDVIAHRPTVVTIMLGMNDGGYKPFDQATFDTYASGYRRIVARLKESLPGVRITVIKPSAFDDVTRPLDFAGGYNAVLLPYSNFLEELARAETLTIADFNKPVVAGLQRVNAANAQLARQIIPDRVHPGEPGHMIMARALLETWGAPTVVTAVDLDAGAARVVRSENTQVSGLEKTATGLAWSQLDGALPLPLRASHGVPELARLAGGSLEDLNRQPLRVTGLPAGGYWLTVDGKKVGAFAERELSEGIDLAAHWTPMAEQALTVHLGIPDHNDEEALLVRLQVGGKVTRG